MGRARRADDAAYLAAGLRATLIMLREWLDADHTRQTMTPRARESWERQIAAMHDLLHRHAQHLPAIWNATPPPAERGA